MRNCRKGSERDLIFRRSKLSISSKPIQASQASQEWTNLLFRGLLLLSGEPRLLSQRSCQLPGGSRVTSIFSLPLFAAAHCYLQLCAVICCCLLMHDCLLPFPAGSHLLLFAALRSCFLPSLPLAAVCYHLLPFAAVFCCLLLCVAACRYCFRLPVLPAILIPSRWRKCPQKLQNSSKISLK